MAKFTGLAYSSLDAELRTDEFDRSRCDTAIQETATQFHQCSRYRRDEGYIAWSCRRHRDLWMPSAESSPSPLEAKSVWPRISWNALTSWFRRGRIANGPTG